VSQSLLEAEDDSLTFGAMLEQSSVGMLLCDPWAPGGARNCLAKGRNGTAELLAILTNEQDDRIPAAARFSLDVLARQYAVLTTEIGIIEKRIHAWH
jgi:hypothetical protein